MPSPSGLISGTKALLIKELSNGTQIAIGALISNSSAFNRALIEITNKSSDQFREYLTGDEGTKSADHSCECYFSSQDAYNEMRDAFFSGEIGTYLFSYDGAKTDLFKFKVENFSDAANLNEAVKSSFSLKSDGEFEIDVLFELLTTNDDNDLSANNDDIIFVRVA